MMLLMLPLMSSKTPYITDPGYLRMIEEFGGIMKDNLLMF